MPRRGVGRWSETALSRTESRVLQALPRDGRPLRVEDVSAQTGINREGVMSAASSLREAKLVLLTMRNKIELVLTEEGRRYADPDTGLPERRLFRAVRGRGGRMSIEDATEAAALDAEERRIALTWLIKKGWGTVKGGVISLRLEAAPKGQDEYLLEELFAREQRHEELSWYDETPRGHYPDGVEICRARKLVSVKRGLEVSLALTEEGVKQAELAEGSANLSASMTLPESVLTAEMIRTGRWRSVALKRYNMDAKPPAALLGRKNPYMEFLEEVRGVMLEMGFEEWAGPIVETEFWHFDALFQAQDHPAREVFDSFHLERPRRGELPDPGYVERVRLTHENGWETGSRGWGYRWSLETAARTVLRAQTTSVSMRYLYTHKTPPVKMFIVSDCFRYDVQDATHNIQFVQAEGIVGDRGITLRSLFGVLSEFARRLGFKEVRFSPCYFPFTEPSVEAAVLHPRLGWVECLGAGMFRPEVLKPLSIDFPVIAWGIGVDRLAMAALDMDDIRLFRAPDLESLRKARVRL